MRILYVEDNPANLSLLQRIARMGGHEVVSYTEGESALKNYEKDNPDLVLMDVQLSGGMNGLDVVRKLRERGHKTPIIAVTAYAMTGDRERCIEAGCDTYIAKPLPVAELVELVQKYAASKQAAAAPAAASAGAPESAPPDLKEQPSAVTGPVVPPFVTTPDVAQPAATTAPTTTPTTPVPAVAPTAAVPPAPPTPSAAPVPPAAPSVMADDKTLPVPPTNGNKPTSASMPSNVPPNVTNFTTKASSVK